MSRKCQVCVTLVLGIVFSGSAMVANATLITADGDFAAETNGAQVGSDWPVAEYASGSTASQSPFTNLFATNDMGVEMSGGGYMGTYTTSAPSLITTGLLNLNVDFRYDTLSSDPDGGFSFDVTKNVDGSQRALNLSVTSSGVYADSSSGIGDSLLTPVLGTWYNVQLALNVDAGTYSGTITPYGGASVAISSRDFDHNVGIDCIYTNNEGPGGAYGGSGNPTYAVDNFALSTVSPVPEPGALTLLSTGLIGLLCYAWRKRK